MPWKEMSPMIEKMRFVLDYEKGLFGMTQLAEQYGISRKTAYKWLDRFHEYGAAGLEDRPSVAERVANRTARDMEHLIVRLREKQKTWGPKKLLDTLARKHPHLYLPARSTVAEILKRYGLVETRPRRRREGHPGRPMSRPEAPNDIWGGDFKGQFRTLDGLYCYPFTVSDLCSRYLICCDGQLSTAMDPVQAALQSAFVSTACLTPFAPTTARPSLLQVSDASPDLASGF